MQVSIRCRLLPALKALHNNLPLVIEAGLPVAATSGAKRICHPDLPMVFGIRANAGSFG